MFVESQEVAKYSFDPLIRSEVFDRERGLRGSAADVSAATLLSLALLRRVFHGVCH